MEPSVNLQRMLDLADKVFDVANDPEQIDFSENAVAQLLAIHEATLAEHVDGDGPVAWVAVFPTQKQLMNDFLDGKISEKTMLNLTSSSEPFQCIYLCSALVLPEWRNQGLATSLAVQSISNIRMQHPIQALFAWSFSQEGGKLAQKIANKTGLTCYLKSDNR
jgi:hypothetical protein